MTIAIIDYGNGNLASLLRSCERINVPAVLAKTAEQIRAASKLVLPGVGHFAECVRGFEASGLRPAVENEVLKRHKPMLGICVGYQMMAKWSEEGDIAGLGWLDGRVRRIPAEHQGQRLRVPHVGWNELIGYTGTLFKDMGERPRFYFAHSYFVELADPALAVATCRYGFEFAAGAGVGNLYGVQFHPEKSHDTGLNLIRNFATS